MNLKAQSIAKHLGIEGIKKIIVLKYETMDTKKAPKSAQLIQDKNKLKAILKLLDKVNADGQVWEDLPASIPTSLVFIMDDKGKYFELTIYGDAIRSLISKNGSFGLGDGEDELVALLLGKKKK